MIATGFEVPPFCDPSILESPVSQAGGRLWVATCLGVTAPDCCTHTVASPQSHAYQLSYPIFSLQCSRGSLPNVHTIASHHALITIHLLSHHLGSRRCSASVPGVDSDTSCLAHEATLITNRQETYPQLTAHIAALGLT
jgi:hypothetical protein